MAEIIPATSYVNPTWLITPAVTPSNQIGGPPSWLVVLSGIAVAEFTAVGQGTSEYTILVEPDVSEAINWGTRTTVLPPAASWVGAAPQS